VCSVALVDGKSMQPTLNPQGTKDRDVVLLDKMSADERVLQRGDVVILDSPQDPKRQIVKRLIGLPGDWIKSRSGDLKNVPKGKCWIEGDNHVASLDSERYGPVPISMVRARVTHLLWPPSRWGRVPEDERFKSKDRLFIANNKTKGDFPRRKKDDFW